MKCDDLISCMGNTTLPADGEHRVGAEGGQEDQSGDSHNSPGARWQHLDPAGSRGSAFTDSSFILLTVPRYPSLLFQKVPAITSSISL